MKREHFDMTPAVTIGDDGILRVFGRAVDYSRPFVLIGGMVAFLTSDTNMQSRK